MTFRDVHRRIEALEAVSGSGGGCDRCRGFLTVVKNAITGEFNSASYNGVPISKEELEERQGEAGCPQCGSRIPSAQLIKVKGL